MKSGNPDPALQCSRARPSCQEPDILGGTPVFVGTRVPVQSLFDHLEAGDSSGDFLGGFPNVRRGQVIAVLEESCKERLQPA